jgi:hypothetical protein
MLYCPSGKGKLRMLRMVTLGNMVVIFKKDYFVLTYQNGTKRFIPGAERNFSKLHRPIEVSTIFCSYHCGKILSPFGVRIVDKCRYS